MGMSLMKQLLLCKQDWDGLPNLLTVTILLDAKRSRRKKAGVPRKLCGFTMIEKGIPRQGYEILNENREVIGKVTSGTISPVLKVGIGLGYVKPDVPNREPLFISIFAINPLKRKLLSCLLEKYCGMIF